MKKISSEKEFIPESAQYYTSRPSTASSRNIKIKKISIEKEIIPETAHFYTSRPSTASSRNVNIKKISSEKEFLPDKGSEFASEIIKIWDSLKNKREKAYESKENCSAVKKESYDTEKSISLEKKYKFAGLKETGAERKEQLTERKEENKIEDILEEYQDQLYPKQQRKTVVLKIPNLPKDSTQDGYFQGPPPVFTRHFSNGFVAKADKNTRQIKENENIIIGIQAEPKVLTQRPSSGKILVMKSKNFKFLNANQSNNA